jgi:hypothetical protein
VFFSLLLFLEKDQAHAHESQESSLENHGLFLGMLPGALASSSCVRAFLLEKEKQG